MKTEEIHGMSDAELHRRLEESRQELFNLRFQIAMRKTKNHQRIPAVKKDIARMMTALRERELMDMYGGIDVELVPHEEAVPAGPEQGRRGNLLGRLGRNSNK